MNQSQLLFSNILIHEKNTSFIILDDLIFDVPCSENYSHHVLYSGGGTFFNFIRTSKLCPVL